MSCCLYESFILFFSFLNLSSFVCLLSYSFNWMVSFFIHSCLLSTCSFLPLLRYKIQVSLCNNTSLYLVSLGELIVTATVFLLTEMQHSSRCIPSPAPKEWHLPSKCKRQQWHFLLADTCAFFSLQHTQYLAAVWCL